MCLPLCSAVLAGLGGRTLERCCGGWLCSKGFQESCADTLCSRPLPPFFSPPVLQPRLVLPPLQRVSGAPSPARGRLAWQKPRGPPKKAALHANTGTCSSKHSNPHPCFIAIPNPSKPPRLVAPSHFFFDPSIVCMAVERAPPRPSQHTAAGRGAAAATGAPAPWHPPHAPPNSLLLFPQRSTLYDGQRPSSRAVCVCVL